MEATTIAGIVIVVLILLVGAAFLLGNALAGTRTTTQAYTTVSSGGQTSVSQSSSSVPVAVTDPAQVPSGTSALVVEYSSVQADESGPSGSGWVNASGSGSVDLTSTVNSGQVIGYVNATSGTTVSAVKMAVTSAYIVVNGTTYNVTVPQQTITAQVSGQTNVNQSSTVLVDMSPTVSAVYNQNSTAFVMAPSTKAVVVANSGASAQSGTTFSLNANAQASLSSATPSITITSANVSVSGNVTTVAVTVHDNSNSTVTLNNVVLYGQQKASASSSANGNASIIGNLNGALGGGSSVGVGTSLQAALKVGLNLQLFQQAVFVASSNGSLAQVTGEGSFSSGGTSVNSDSSTTLAYSGDTTYDSGLYTAKVVAGAPYRIVVTGQNGATATATVTATAG